MRALWIVLVAGCFHRSVWTTCEETATPVADDEETELGTAQAMLDRLTGGFEEPAVRDDGAPVTATVDIVRGEGTAEYVELVGVEVVERELGWPGTTVSTHDLSCDPYLRVPVSVSFATDDGVFDVGMDGVAGTDAPNRGDGVLHVAASAPFEGSGFPEPPDVDLEAWFDQEAFLDVYDYPEGYTVGDVGWSAHQENSAMAWRAVEWPTD